MRLKTIFTVPQMALLWIVIMWVGIAARGTVIWAAYKVVLKDGRVIEARTKPVSMEGQYRFTGTNGQFYAIPSGSVDAKGTESANQTKQEPAPAPKRYTNEDLSGKNDSTASSISSSNPGETGKRPAQNASSVKDPASSNSNRGEQYWKKRAKVIQDQLVAVEKQILELSTKVKDGKSEGIKMGMGTYTPYMVAGFENQLGTLEKEKAKLQKEFAALEEEARKAGALPGWLR